eukprot:TRINITY_DN4433_c0_g1_i1.p1 TRINITY_DN4433_c0_g1~~TRINITY_DN4433_c0_g1_i1.p1  ORF type:complete len:314 (+),score=68.27 TRINITY_DN4433_c0_g1_i1:44-985(+)
MSTPQSITQFKIFGFSAAVVGAVLFNIVVSTLLVSVNKSLFYYQGFHYGTGLTLIHFVASALGLRVMAMIGLMNTVYISPRDIMSLSLAHAVFVSLNNLSLQYNSVGFYQVMKAFTIPLVVIIQYLFYNHKFSVQLQLSLAITCLGILFATTHDVQFNILGTVIAILGEVAKATSQVLTGNKHTELKVNSMQLLYHQAPISACYLVFLTVIFDDISVSPDSFQTIEFDHGIVTMIFVSSLLAFAFNLSNYYLIDMVGPLTYNVIGHFKTIAVIVIGNVYFGYKIVFENLLGIALTIAGLAWYSHIKTRGQQSH